MAELLLTCQIGAVVEVLNPLFGVVRTGILAPLIQVSSFFVKTLRMINIFARY